jgi:hypothetical protein
MAHVDFSTNKTLVKVNGKTIGWLENRIFHKHVLGSKHKLKFPAAWSIDAEAFDNEVKHKASQIEVLDKETGHRYTTSAECFDRFKIELNRGFGRQYALTLTYWKVEDYEHRQLSLFGGSL